MRFEPLPDGASGNIMLSTEDYPGPTQDTPEKQDKNQSGERPPADSGKAAPSPLEKRREQAPEKG